jgi:hypothetical protein
VQKNNSRTWFRGLLSERKEERQYLRFEILHVVTRKIMPVFYPHFRSKTFPCFFFCVAETNAGGFSDSSTDRYQTPQHVTSQKKAFFKKQSFVASNTALR